MQTLRKRNSPCKFKNEPTRFLGEGVSFKAKLIGILEVSEARGDRMCQAALADLKMAIRAAGEHKQRIAVQVSIDGLRLRDEKSGECLYHHPVHKISFIAQDMSDSRAFGYIFGSPDTGHRFFGIKTDKAASQVVIAMRDLFQVVFELKKKEIELAKQHIEQTAINVIKFHTSGIFVEPAPDTKGAAGTESSLHRIRNTSAEMEKPAAATPGKNESQSGVIADLLDLQFELNSLQQGIHQMDKITPENPLPSTDELFETDPFGDSFANMKVKETVRPILPPPPSTSKRGHLERQQTVPAPPTSATSSPATTLSSKTPPPQGTIHWFDKETENLFSDGELASLTKNSVSKKDQEDNSLTTTPRNAQAKSPQIDVFTELDPLGTGLIKPSSDTFPTTFNITTDPLEAVKVQSELSSRDNDCFEDNNFANFDRFDESGQSSSMPRSESPQKKEVTPRANHHQPLSVSLPPEDATLSRTIGITSVANASGVISALARIDKDTAAEPVQSLVKLPSPKKYGQSLRKGEFDIDLPGSRGQSIDKPFPVDFSATSDSPASPLRSCSSEANSRLSSSSAELDLVPEPPPRGAGSILINPPPLPPKKQGTRGGIKPPPRPPYTEGHFHYDFLEREKSSPSPTRARERNKSPSKDAKGQFDDNFSPPPLLPGRSDLISSITTSAFEDSFSSMIPTTNLSSFFTSTPAETKRTKPSLDITLSQLTSSNLDELAGSLGMSVQELTSLTLQQLTECLATLVVKDATSSESVKSVPAKTEPVVTSKPQPASKPVESIFDNNQPLFKTNFDQEPQQDPTYDKYAVLRELAEMEQMRDETKMQTSIEDETSNLEEQESEGAENHEIIIRSESITETHVSLVNLTVKLPPTRDDDLLREQPVSNVEELAEHLAELIVEKNRASESEDKDESKDDTNDSMILESSTRQLPEEEPEEDSDNTHTIVENDDRLEASEKGSDVNSISEKVVVESNAEEANGSSTLEKPEMKSSTSMSSDKYAALREITGEPERIDKKSEEGTTSPVQASPISQPPLSKSLVEVELMNLFADNLPPSASPIKISKKEEDLKAVAMDIFEEIKMLNTATPLTGEPGKPSSGFEDVFYPFGESKPEREDSKEDGNWAKFDTGVFSSDRSSGEGPRSVGGTSPWSPDGKDFHREAPFKSNAHRLSGDSDNEWKDEEESEESNGRARGEGRFWCVRHPRFDAPGFEERSFYEESNAAPGDKRERSFRERMGRKSRGAPWGKGAAHRPRDPSPWHEDSQWEEEQHRRYGHRKMPYKDDDDQYEAHWKCRSKSQRWNWGHEHSPFYDEERKRKLMLWNEEDRFGSQESMGYDDEDRWSRRKYERRRWEEDGRFWGRRGPPPDSEYAMRDSYYYYRDGRDRPHDYPGTWDEDYGSERPGDDSPRYNTSGRKRHWPKRPNSANEGRNTEMVYTEPRSKFGASRSECSDNDSDPYLRSSQRSRSRESYWESDQEYDSWVERPYWSEGPDSKSETLHRKRIARHKARPPQAKTQSPFEDDFAQSVEHVESPALESLPPVEPHIRPEIGDQKREPPSSSSPLSSARSSSKDHPRRETPRDYNKRSSYFDDDLTPTASASSDASDRQRPSSDLKATPEEITCETKDSHQSIDGFPSEDTSRDSFFNGDLRFEDDAFAFKAELEDSVPDHRATTLPLKNSRQSKYGTGNNNNNNNRSRNDQYIRKSESVNIFVRENDPFDDDDFFN